MQGPCMSLSEPPLTPFPMLPPYAEFQDSSVRLLDCASVSPDKSAATCVPQLSTHALVSAFCSLSTGRLFTLLSNSHIHVWEIHLKGPPTFLSAWTHLAREACVCMADVDGELCDKGIVSALGMEAHEGERGEGLLEGRDGGPGWEGTRASLLMDVQMELLTRAPLLPSQA